MRELFINWLDKYLETGNESYLKDIVTLISIEVKQNEREQK